ncbi:PepSY domain-containing protein, partial [Sulfurovum sp.]
TASETEEIKAAKVGINEVLAAIEAKLSGKITKVELENEEGNLVYEAEVFQKDGKTFNVVVDAGTAQVLTSSVDKPDHEDENDNEKDEEKED